MVKKRICHGWDEYAAIWLARSERLLTVMVGSIPHGSKMASGERWTHAAFMPAEIAPITSKGLLETSQAWLPQAPARRRKWQYTPGFGLNDLTSSTLTTSRNDSLIRQA